MPNQRIPLTTTQQARLISYGVYPGSDENADPRRVLDEVDRVVSPIASGDFEIVEFGD